MIISSQLSRFHKKVFDKKSVSFNPKIMVYVLGFLYALQITPSIYMDSSFLKQFVGANNVGLVFSVASLTSIIGIVWTRRFLQVFGNYWVFRSIVFFNLLSFGFLSLHLILPPHPILSATYVFLFIVGFTSRTLGFLSIDIFLERYSNDSETGGIRGIFLTSVNVAFMAGPLIAAAIIPSEAKIANAYLWAFFFALIIIKIAKKYFKDFKDHKYEKSLIFQTLREVRGDRNLSSIFMCNLILNVFYALAVIYLPIFLNVVVGFSISQVVLLIAISQIPFVILQIPLGKIADKFLGEQEILTAGLVITSVFVFLMSVINTNSFLIWSIIVFGTRIGASSVEVMTESYLFKQIHSGSINILGLYRVMLPFSYITAPVMASLLLIWFRMEFLFLIVSFILFYGIRYSLKFRDSR